MFICRPRLSPRPRAIFTQLLPNRKGKLLSTRPSAASVRLAGAAKAAAARIARKVHLRWRQPDFILID